MAMLNVTDLIAGPVRPGGAREAAHRAPMVVWSATRRCNLACRHCYSDSTGKAVTGELSSAEAPRP